MVPQILSWKVRVTILVEESDLWEIVKDIVPFPTDPQQLAVLPPPPPPPPP
jgi:hypothetical protein